MLVFNISFKSLTNCCGKRRGTPLWFLPRLARLYFLGKDENLAATLMCLLSVLNSSPILSLRPLHI